MIFSAADSAPGTSGPLLLIPSESNGRAAKLTLVLGLISAAFFLAACLAWRATRDPAPSDSATALPTLPGTAEKSSSVPATRGPHKERTSFSGDGPSLNLNLGTTNQAATSPLTTGTSGEWVGELERIWGIVGSPGELHFRVKLERSNAQSTLLEAAVPGVEFARHVIDYETTEERTEVASSTASSSRAPGSPGDKVKVSGVVVAPEAFEYRITPRGTPFVRLTRIERLGDPNSQAIVGQQRRSASFQRPTDSQALADVLRVHPSQGQSLTLQGVFQRWEEESETILMALGKEGRAAEITFPRLNFADYQPGDRVRAVATTTGQIFQRVEQYVVWQRPYLAGETILRPDKPTELARAVDPSTRPSRARNTSSDEASSLGERNGPRAAIAGETASGSNEASPSYSPTVASARSATEIFIASEEGETALLVEGQWQTLNLPSPFPTQIKCAYLDRQNTCWLGGKGGVVILDGQNIRTCAKDEGFPRGTISCVLEDLHDRMWVGSWEDGIACLETNEWRHRKADTPRNQDLWKQYRKRDGLCLDNVNALAEDGAGRLWIGTCNFDPPGSGISILKDGRFQNELLPQQMAELSVQSMHQAPGGDVYIGFIGGLLIIEPNLQAKVNQSLPQRTPQATFIDSQGRLWAGTWGGGLVQIDTSDAKVMPDLALPAAGHVRKICEDAGGRLWASGLEGLWKLEKETWHRVALPHGISRVAVVAAVPTTIAQQLVQLSGTQRSAGASTGKSSAGKSDPPNSPSKEKKNSLPIRSAEETTETTVAELLTDTGRLKETLRVEEFLNATIDGGNTLLTIETYQVVAIGKDGRWRSSWRITGGTPTVSGKKLNGLDQGQLDESDLRYIASKLKANNLLNLPKDITERRTIVASAGTLVRRIVVNFGSKKYQATYQVTDPELSNSRTRTQEAELARIESIVNMILAIPDDRPGLNTR